MAQDGGGRRLRDHERQEAGEPDDPDAVGAGRPRQRGPIQGLVEGSWSDGRRHLPGRTADRLHPDGDRPRSRDGRDVQEGGGRRARECRGRARAVRRQSGFMGKVGEDGFGRFLADTLAAAGVDVRRCASPERRGRRSPSSRSVPTASASSCSTAPQRRHAVRARGCGRSRDRAREVLHFGSIGLIGEPSRAGTLHAVTSRNGTGSRSATTRTCGCRYGPTPTPRGRGSRLGLEQADIVKISEEEVQFLTGIDDPIEGARALWHENLALMAVTRGAKGCLWLSKDARARSPASRSRPWTRPARATPSWPDSSPAWSARRSTSYRWRAR